MIIVTQKARDILAVLGGIASIITILPPLGRFALFLMGHFSYFGLALNSTFLSKGFSLLRLCSVLFLLVLIVFYNLYYWLKYSVPPFRVFFYYAYLWLRNYQYEEIKKSITYNMTNRQCMNYRHDLTLRARHHRARLYAGSFRWSGDGDPHATALHPQDSVIFQKSLGSAGDPKTFVILFGMTFNRNEIIKTGYQINELSDSKQEAARLLSCRVGNPTKHLKLRVQFSIQDAPCEVFLHISKHPGQHSKRIKRIEPTVIGDCYEYIFEIAMPYIGHTYRLEWDK